VTVAVWTPIVWSWLIVCITAVILSVVITVGVLLYEHGSTLIYDIVHRLLDRGEQPREVRGK
jgi:hypothetical protein